MGDFQSSDRDYYGIDEPQALIIAASLESLSEHPLGQSILRQRAENWSKDRYDRYTCDRS